MESDMRKKISEQIVKGTQIPQHLLMMTPAHLFNFLVNFWMKWKVKERRKISQGIIRDLLGGMKTCKIHELTLSGLREENPDDWHNLFTIISSDQAGLQNVALIIDGLKEEHMSTLFAALNSLPSLIHLDLSVNMIGNIFVQLADHPMRNLKL